MTSLSSYSTGEELTDFLQERGGRGSQGEWEESVRDVWP